MTTRDIQDLVKELYGVDVSPTLISEITADLDREVKSWQTRRLDSVCPIVYLAGMLDGPEESRLGRHLHRLRRRLDWLSRGDSGCLSANESSALHRPPGSSGTQVRDG